MRDRKSKFIIKQGLKDNNCFITLNDPGRDQTRLISGEVVYKIVGYANTMEEAQEKLYSVVLVSMVEALK